MHTDVEYSTYLQADGTTMVYACVHLGRDAFIGSSGSVARNDSEVLAAHEVELSELTRLLNDMGYEIVSTESSAKRAQWVTVIGFAVKSTFKITSLLSHINLAPIKRFINFIGQPVQD